MSEKPSGQILILQKLFYLVRLAERLFYLTLVRLLFSRNLPSQWRVSISRGQIIVPISDALFKTGLSTL